MGAQADTAARREAVERIARLVEAIEDRDRARGTTSGAGGEAVPTGWRSVDAETGGLPRRALHEWMGVADGPVGGELVRRPAPAPAPLLVLLHLAERALRGAEEESGPRGWVFWVGRRVWPYARVLLREPSPCDTPPRLDERDDPPPGREDPRALLERSVFVDPPDDATRLWAVDLTLRCPSARCVVADGSRLSMSASRRLQLAAESGRALALLARPPTECHASSVACSRWVVGREAGEAGSLAPRFRLDLLRWKPSRRGTASPLVEASGDLRRGTWTLEWDHATCAVVEPSPVRRRPGEEAFAPGRLRPAV